MPLTEFQREVLILLRAHRNPNSYVAGGVAIHRAPTSARQSNDIDFFHDTDEAVLSSANADLALLKKTGFTVQILINQPSFVRGVITRGRQSLKLEWVRDTAFRFFPVIEDEDLGYRLHDVDLAVNKCLALANRNEVRDIIDLMQFHRNIIELSSACWAACGKDPGFTPELLVDCMRRHSIIRPEQLAAESLVERMTPVELKKAWFQILSTSETLLKKFPAEDLGCLYLSRVGEVIYPVNPAKFSDNLRHFGSIGGSWPRLVTT